MLIPSYFKISNDLDFHICEFCFKRKSRWYHLKGRWREPQPPILEEYQQFGSYPQIKIALQEFRDQFKKLQQQVEQKNLKINNSKREEQLRFCLYHLILRMALLRPKKELPRLKELPLQEREPGVSEQLSQALGTLQEGSISVSLPS